MNNITKAQSAKVTHARAGRIDRCASCVMHDRCGGGTSRPCARVQWLINFGTFDALHRMLAARHCVNQMVSPVVFDLVGVATVEVWHHRSYVYMHTYSI